MLKSFYFHYSQPEYTLDDKESHLWAFRFTVESSLIFYVSWNASSVPETFGRLSLSNSTRLKMQHVNFLALFCIYYYESHRNEIFIISFSLKLSEENQSLFFSILYNSNCGSIFRNYFRHSWEILDSFQHIYFGSHSSVQPERLRMQLADEVQ